jgi:hypothetical protein
MSSLLFVESFYRHAHNALDRSDWMTLGGELISRRHSCCFTTLFLHGNGLLISMDVSSRQNAQDHLWAASFMFNDLLNLARIAMILQVIISVERGENRAHVLDKILILRYILLDPARKTQNIEFEKQTVHIPLNPVPPRVFLLCHTNLPE